MTVRDGIPEDAARIAEIHVASWRAAYRGLLPDEGLAALDVEAFRDWRHRRLVGGFVPRSATLVVEDSGAVAGFADVGPARDGDAAGAGEVYAIYVDPARWRRGLGGRLLAAASARLRAEGFERGVLWVLEANRRARRFYEAMGWRHDGSRRFESVHDIQVLEVRYACDLVKTCT